MSTTPKKRVLVVGAGASKEAELPTGDELKQKIAEVLDIRFNDGVIRSSGDALIEEAFRRMTREVSGHSDINPFLHVCWRIRDAMPLAASIDNLRVCPICPGRNFIGN
jgi:hypothetical protein